jgi:hypothetical protein
MKSIDDKQHVKKKEEQMCKNGKRGKRDACRPLPTRRGIVNLIISVVELSTVHSSFSEQC